MNTNTQRNIVLTGILCCSLLVLPGLVCPLLPAVLTPSSETTTTETNSTNTTESTPGGQALPGNTTNGTPAGQNATGTQGATGAQGPQGAQGPAGPQGPAGVVTGGPGVTITGGSTVSLDMNVLDGSYWRLGGNTGGAATNQIGTTNNTAFALMANSQAILNLNPAGGARFNVNDNKSFEIRYESTNNSLVTLSSGAFLTANGVLFPVCDRNKKANFVTVDGRDTLAKVAALPISIWNYKDEQTSVQHMGPMAQDFRAAFGLGLDDVHLSTLDTSGVALAAIQGLNSLVLEKQQQIDALEARLSKLEAALNK